MTVRDKLYGRRWRTLRQNFLTENPLCRMCKEEGKITAAREVDHIDRHKGDIIKFFDVTNLQPLCRYHHRVVKARMERSGKYIGTRIDGTPMDATHYWNQQ